MPLNADTWHAYVQERLKSQQQIAVVVANYEDLF